MSLILHRHLAVSIKIALFVLLLTAFGHGRAHAHTLGQSYIFLSIYDRLIQGRFEMTAGDLNQALGLDFRTDGTVTIEEVDTHIQVIKSYLLEKVKMAPNGVPVDIRLTEYRLFSPHTAQYVVIEFVLDNLLKSSQHVDIDYAVLFDVDPKHRGLLVIEHNWKTNTFNDGTTVSLIFSPSGQHRQLDLSSSSVLRGFLGLVRLGVDHIWAGIDHVLFLLALLLPSVVHRQNRQWEPVGAFRTALIHVVKIVTFFTIAHSVTLSLAALQLVQVPSRLVESMIAISIAVAAVDIVVPVLRGRVWWVVFGFGLFHGFGFASVLSLMGISSTYMPLSLFGFNLGVEIGQIAIVCLAFPVLFAISRTQLYTRYMLGAGAVLLILVSLYWFVERAFEVDLPAGVLLQHLVALWA